MYYEFFILPLFYDYLSPQNKFQEVINRISLIIL
jgi:hypothetical protein